jgi:hypothetical protein
MPRLFPILAFGTSAMLSISAFAHPIRNESPMEPGLWDMTITGAVHVPSANLNEPIHRTVRVCIREYESPAEPFLPANHGRCTTAHAPMVNGKERWKIHCTVPHAVVNQVGWIQSLPQTMDSHWRITEVITGPASYTTETTLRMQGNRVGPTCGSTR